MIISNNGTCEQMTRQTQERMDEEKQKRGWWRKQGWQEPAMTGVDSGFGDSGETRSEGVANAERVEWHGRRVPPVEARSHR